jgi:hypothetical protein
MLSDISKKEAENLALNIIYDRIGSTLGIGTPELGETELNNETIPIWIVPLKADYPRSFVDYTTKLPQEVVLHLGDVGEIEIDARTGEEISVTHKHTIGKSVFDRMDNVRRGVEKLLVRTASLQFAKLVNVKYMFSPIRKIVTNVLDNGKVSFSELTDVGYNPRYVTLLERSNFVVVEEKIVRPSPTLSDFYTRNRQQMERDEALNTTIEGVLNEIIHGHYDFVYNTLKLRQLAPYVQISTTYYDYALSINNLFSASEDDLKEAYKDVYGMNQKKDFGFRTYLNELSMNQVGIMRQTKTTGLWRGNEKIFQTMTEQNPLSIFVTS